MTNSVPGSERETDRQRERGTKEEGEKKKERRRAGSAVPACASARSRRGWEFGLPRVPTPSVLHHNSDTTT